jgi:hypothetical protein
MWNRSDSYKILRLDQLPSGWILTSAAKIRNISFRDFGYIYRQVKKNINPGNKSY